MPFEEWRSASGYLHAANTGKLQTLTALISTSLFQGRIETRMSPIRSLRNEMVGFAETMARVANKLARATVPAVL